MNFKKNQYIEKEYLSFSKKSYQNRNGVLYKRYISISNFIKNKKIKKILDAGSGDGYLLNLLAKNTKSSFYGVEKEKLLINFCKKYKKKNLIFLNDDLRSLKKIQNSSMDLVITLGTLNNNNRSKILNNIKKKLKKNGYIILSAQNILYDFISFNKVSKLFYKEFFSIKSKDLIEFNQRTASFSNFVNPKSFSGYNFKTIKNYKNFYKINPLTVKDFFLTNFSLDLIKLEFYNPHRFKNIPIEKNITSWKKFFLCSGLLIFLKKN